MISHRPALSAKALSFDDTQYLTENHLVQNPSWQSAKRFLTEILEPSTVQGYYQPLAMISLMTDYVIADDKTAIQQEDVRGCRAALGIGKDFSRKDKIIYLATGGWSFFWIAVFIIGTVYNIFVEVNPESWARFWHLYIWLWISLSSITTVWLAPGGFIDLKKMYRRLATMIRDDSDDGTVTPEETEQ